MSIETLTAPLGDYLIETALMGHKPPGSLFADMVEADPRQAMETLDQICTLEGASPETKNAIADLFAFASEEERSTFLSIL